MSFFKDDTCLSSHSGEIQSCSDSNNALGVLLRILGAGVPPGSPNPNRISDLKMSFFTSVFRPGGGHRTQLYMFLA